MKVSVCLIISMILIIRQGQPDPIDFGTDFIFGSIRNVTLGATTYISDTIQKQKEIILHAKDTATNYVSNAVAVPKQMLIDVKNATTKYIASTATRSMETKVRSLLEIVRIQMPYGIPALDLPVLEPLKIEHMELSTTNKDIGNISGTIDNVTITQLSTFVVDKVKLSVLDEVSIALNISVPKILANGTYEMSGMIGKLFALNGTGPFHVEVNGARFYVHTVLGYSGAVYVKSIDLDFNMESVNAFFHRLFQISDDMQEQMNKVVSKTIPQLLEILKPDLKPVLQDFIAQRINATVSRLTMGNIIGILTGTVDIQTVPQLTTIHV